MDEMAAWVREQAEGDVARARMAGVFVSDPRTEGARSEAVLAILGEYEAARSAATAGTGHPRQIREDAGPGLTACLRVLDRVVRLLAWGYRYREGWQETWKP